MWFCLIYPNFWQVLFYPKKGAKPYMKNNKNDFNFCLKFKVSSKKDNKFTFKLIIPKQRKLQKYTCKEMKFFVKTTCVVYLLNLLTPYVS